MKIVFVILGMGLLTAVVLAMMYSGPRRRGEPGDGSAQGFWLGDTSEGSGHHHSHHSDAGDHGGFDGGGGGGHH
ncbi:MAG TPA: hypothetical protein VGI93_18290 [Steroidobacteraceae bacterium]|jgi:hypothetical protein